MRSHDALFTGPSVRLAATGPWTCSMCDFEFLPFLEGLEARFDMHVAAKHPEHARRRDENVSNVSG